IWAKEGGKEIWWKKPQALPPQQSQEGPSEDGRSLEEMVQDWWIGKFPSKADVTQSSYSQRDSEKEIKRELGRKQRAIGKIEADLKKNREIVWRQVADWIHQHQNLNVPEEWAKFVDQEQTFSWNLERCYQKAKDLKSKREGTIERLHLLQAEVEALKAGELPIKPGPEFKGKIKEKNSGRQVKARKLQLGDQFVAYVGKSAKDNLQLLRQARAWDLWLHLRDYPGSHCIIQRNKGETVPESLLREASQWVARATFGRKAEQKQGEKLTVLFAECRHVRPIKGDKMGRVTFRNETTLTIEFAP
ncbi:MAG: hypothetical protein KDD43_12810, partial [Bdellovibrionales bacterium]|nr:hypothetical protein [Bdellovibrionales bacterium]